MVNIPDPPKQREAIQATEGLDLSTALAYVGHTVHYVVAPGGDETLLVCRAAIITEVPTTPEEQSLFVLQTAGSFFCVAPFDPAGAASTWHWREGER